MVSQVNKRATVKLKADVEAALYRLREPDLTAVEDANLCQVSIWREGRPICSFRVDTERLHLVFGHGKNAVKCVAGDWSEFVESMLIAHQLIW